MAKQTATRTFHGRVRAMALGPSLLLFVFVSLCKAQTSKSCLMKGDLSFSASTTTQNQPLLMNTGDGHALRFSLVPIYDIANHVSALRMEIGQQNAVNKKLKILGEDRWKDVEPFLYDAANYSEEADAPDTHRLVLPDLGVNLEVLLKDVEIIAKPPSFTQLHLEICAHAISNH